MFHELPQPLYERMRDLEQRDALDRTDDTPRQQRLRQVPPETGRFIALLATLAPTGRMIEIGTSAGYSALWLSLACRSRNRRLTTFEVDPDKAELATETIRVAGVTDLIELVHGDARDYLADLDGIAFCFIDLEKELYQECYDLVIPRLVDGGLLLADNVISHTAQLEDFLSGAHSDPRLDTVVVPIGKGILVGRRNNSG